VSGWERLIEAARAPNAALAAALNDPEAQQHAFVLDIVRANAETEFGRAHDFGRVRSLADFRTAVPIQSHDAFRPFIERIADGCAGVLTCAPVIAFEETGGTSSGRKLIPYTAESLVGFRAAVLPWLAGLARRRPGMTAGPAYVSTSPATRPVRRMPSGIPIGLFSEAAYLGADLVPVFLSLFAVPPGVATIPNVGAWRLATLRHLVEREDLSFVSIWSPTFFLELIDALPQAGDALSRILGATARLRLAEATRGGGVDTTILWPKLDTISCWADGGSSGFAARLAARCPQAVIEPKGLLATEAAITLPWGSGPGAVPALTSALVEFVDAAGVPLLAHELAVNADYRVVVTTAGGLYRYDMGDLVRCVARTSKMPRLTFVGRAALVSDMVGEKLEEAFVADIFADLGLVAALVPRSGPVPHYELWLDDAAREPEGAAGEVEARLRADPQYAYARDLRQLGPLVILDKPGFSARRNETRAAAGARLGDLKHTAILFDGENDLPKNIFQG
jgi:GH3 auxin-responsive promoter